MDNINRAVRYIYYLSLITLLVIYIFPGSLIGYFLYGNLEKQPNLISNPAGTSINHFIFFVYLSIIALLSHLKKTKFKKTFAFILFLSITLELLHLIIPNRSFEYSDLFANLIGVLLGYFIILIYKKRKNYEQI